MIHLLLQVPALTSYDTFMGLLNTFNLLTGRLYLALYAMKIVRRVMR